MTVWAWLCFDYLCSVPCLFLSCGQSAWNALFVLLLLSVPSTNTSHSHTWHARRYPSSAMHLVQCSWSLNSVLPSNVISVYLDRFKGLQTLIRIWISVETPKSLDLRTKSNDQIMFCTVVLRLGCLQAGVKFVLRTSNFIDQKTKSKT